MEFLNHVIHAWEMVIFDRFGTIGGTIFTVCIFPAFFLTNLLILNFLFLMDDTKEIFESGPLWERILYIIIAGVTHAPGIIMGFLGLFAFIFTAFTSPSDLRGDFGDIFENWRTAPGTCLAITVLGLLTFPFILSMLQLEGESPYDGAK